MIKERSDDNRYVMHHEDSKFYSYTAISYGYQPWISPRILILMNNLLARLYACLPYVRPMEAII